MGWWPEIQDASHAQDCIRKWFDHVEDEKYYAQMAAFLSNTSSYSGAFEKALEELSADIWKTYLGLQGANRLTRAIQTVAGRYGFGMHTADRHVIYIGNVSDDTFLKNLNDRVLWKDSFGLGHGEFSHSYQWLAAGKYFNWEYKTADLYSKTTAKSTKGRELFHLVGRKIVKSQVPLWLWLVDSIRIGESEPSESKEEIEPSESKEEKKPLKSKEERKPPKPPEEWTKEWTETHKEFNGHCFTDATFRNANHVNDTLLKHRDDWFLGWYAAHRKKQLMDLELNTWDERLPNPEQYSGKALRRAKDKIGTSLEVQQAGLRKKYSAKDYEAVVERRLDAREQKKDSEWGVGLKFHGLSGRVPKINTYRG